MRIFFDTEFYEDGRTIELISIGLVREDGAEYYAESTGALIFSAGSQWLIDNVQPHLGPESCRRYKTEISREIAEFAGDKPEFWAYYASYDWVVLCQLYGRMIDLPKDWPMFCRDVKQLQVSINPELKLPEQDGAEHNALADARHTKRMYDFLCNEMNRQATSAA